MTHYIAGSGSHGCLYDHCQSYPNISWALEDIRALFGLSRTKLSVLRQNHYLELGEDYGADYAEITECSCGNPEQHNDA